MVERGGECDAPGGGVRGADGVEKLRDGVVDRRHGLPLAVEPEVPGERTGRRQREPQPEQPAGPHEIGERALPSLLRQRHPGADGGRDEQLRTRSGGDGPDGAHTAREEPDAGEEQSERHGPEMITGVGPDEHPDRSGQGRHAEPLDGGPPAAGAVVDAGEHGGDGGDDTERGAVREHGGEEERPGGQRASGDRTPGHGAALGAEGVVEPGRKGSRSLARGGAGHRAPVGWSRAGAAFGRRWPGCRCPR